MCAENEKQKLIYKINHIKEEKLDEKIKSDVEDVIKNYPDVYMKTRIKEQDSAIQKLDIRNFDYADQIGDLFGVMIVTQDIEEAYKIEADLQRAFPDSVEEDYIKNPKFGYQSIHLNCKIEEVPVEIQIKTEKMKIAQELVHDSIYKNNNLNTKTKNMLSTMAYENINRIMNKEYI